MNTEETQFPELSGIELHYNSVNGLNVQNPNDILKAKGPLQEGSYKSRDTSDHTGSGGNDVPGVSESPGASSIDVYNPLSGKTWTQQFQDNLMKEFEKQYPLTANDVINQKPIDPSWFDLTMKGKDLEFWEQLKIMPRFMILEMIVDPEMEYKFTIISEKGKNRVQHVLGKDLTYNQETILIERYTDALSEKIFGSKDKETVQKIIDAQKLANEMIAFDQFKESMGLVDSRKNSQISFGQRTLQEIQIKDPSTYSGGTYFGGIDPIY